MKNIIILLILLFTVASCNQDNDIDVKNIIQTGVWDDSTSTWDNATFAE